MTTDTSEHGLEPLICTALAGHACEPPTLATTGVPPSGYVDELYAPDVGLQVLAAPALRPACLVRTTL